MLAIVLDRVTYGWSLRATARRRQGRDVVRETLLTPGRGRLRDRARRRRRRGGDRPAACCGSRTSPSPRRSPSSTPTNTAVHLDRGPDVRGRHRRAISDGMINFAARSAARPARRVPWWMVSRRRRLARLEGVAAQRARGHLVRLPPGHRRARDVGIAMDTLRRWSWASRSVGRYRDPTRRSGPARSDRRPADPPAVHGRDADDASVRLPGAGGRAVPRRAGSRRDRGGDLRAAAMHPAHRPRHPWVPRRTRSRRRRPSVDDAGQPCGRCSCRSHVPRSCSA